MSDAVPEQELVDSKRTHNTNDSGIQPELEDQHGNVTKQNSEPINIPLLSLEEVTPESIPLYLQTLFQRVGTLEVSLKYSQELNHELSHRVSELEQDVDDLLDDNDKLQDRVQRYKKRITSLEEDVDDVFAFFEDLGVEIPKSVSTTAHEESTEGDAKKSTVSEPSENTEKTTSSHTTNSSQKSSLFAKKSKFDEHSTESSFGSSRAPVSDYTREAKPTLSSPSSPSLVPSAVAFDPNDSHSPFQITAGARRLMSRLIMHAAPKEIREGKDRLTELVDKVRREEEELRASLRRTPEGLDHEHERRGDSRGGSYGRSFDRAYNRAQERGFDRQSFGRSNYDRAIGVSAAFPEGRPWLKSNANAQSHSYSDGNRRGGSSRGPSQGFGGRKEAPPQFDVDGNPISQDTLNQSVHTATSKWTPKSLTSSSPTATVTPTTSVTASSPSVSILNELSPMTSKEMSFVPDQSTSQVQATPSINSPSLSPSSSSLPPSSPSAPISLLSGEELEKSQALETFGRSTLNRLTEKTLAIFTTKLCDLMEKIETVEGVHPFVSLLFTKALKDPSFASLYASLANSLLTELAVRGKTFRASDGKTSDFKRVVVMECQSVYTTLFEQKEPAGSGASPLKETERDLLRKQLTNASRFFGELYLKDVLLAIVLCAILKLEMEKTKREEEDVEAMVALIKLVGPKLSSAREGANPRLAEEIGQTLNSYFSIFEDIVAKETFSKRIVFMVEDLIEVWVKSWRGKRRGGGKRR